MNGYLGELRGQPSGPLPKFVAAEFQDVAATATTAMGEGPVYCAFLSYRMGRGDPASSEETTAKGGGSLRGVNFGCACMCHPVCVWSASVCAWMWTQTNQESDRIWNGGVLAIISHGRWAVTPSCWSMKIKGSLASHPKEVTESVVTFQNKHIWRTSGAPE